MAFQGFIDYLATTGNINQLLVDALNIDDKYQRFQKFKSYVEEHKLNDPAIDAYLAENEELMYVLENGHKKWYNKEGQVDRAAGPAIIFANGAMHWMRNGKLSREMCDDDGNVLHAIKDEKGAKMWYHNGILHRGNDKNGVHLPAICWSNGTKEWFSNGLRHRSDRDGKGMLLPAIEFNCGGKEWFINGLRHRDDVDENGEHLPAIALANNGLKKWFVNGKCKRNGTDKYGYSLPTIIEANGRQFWQNEKGTTHRHEKNANGYLLPAVIYKNGVCEWLFNGKIYFTSETMTDFVTEDMVPAPVEKQSSVKIELEDGSSISIVSGLKNLVRS
jgi:hypothetical protein